MPAILFFDVVTAVHVMSIVLAFGVTFSYPILYPYFGRNHPQSLAALHHAQVRVGRFLIMPSATVALITGLYLAADRDLFDEVWVQIPMAILILLLALGGAFFTPNEKKAAVLAESDPGGAEYTAVSQKVAKVGALSSLLVLVAIFLMVAKPG